jgi:hypothetical protein
MLGHSLPEAPLQPSWIHQIPEDVLEYIWYSWIPEDIWQHLEDIHDLTSLVMRLERSNETEQIVKAFRSLSEEDIGETLRHAFGIEHIYNSNVVDDHHFLHLGRLLKRLTTDFYGPEVPVPSFTLFGELPTELQDMIWSRALAVERIFEVTLNTSSFERGPSSTQPYDYLRTRPKPINAQIIHLALACTRSNEIVIKKYKSIVAFGKSLGVPSLATRKLLVDYDSDVFYFHDILSFSVDVWSSLSEETAQFREKYHCIRRIACPPKALNRMMCFDIMNGIPCLAPFLEALKNIEELILIQPTSTPPILASPTDAPLSFVPNVSTENFDRHIVDVTRLRWGTMTRKGGPLEHFKNVKLTFREMRYDHEPALSQRLEHYSQELLRKEEE